MNSAEGLALVARVVGGLVIVLVLIAISAKIARRTRHFGGGTDLEIVDRLGISRDNQLAVVRVAGRHLLLGIGPQGVSMLSHLDDAAMAFEPGAPVAALTATDDAAAVQDDRAGAHAGTPTTAPVPPAAPAPVTISDLPEDAVAELVAQFAAAAQFSAAQAEAAARVEAVQSDAAGQAEGDGFEPPLRRPRRRHVAPGEPDATPGGPDAAPAAGTPRAAELPEIPEVQLPGALNLGDYPDLASALRAAGRTTAPSSRHGHDTEADQPGSSSWIPAQRQGSRDTDLSHATSSAPVSPETAETSGTSEASAAEPGAGSAGRRRGRSRRVPQQGQVQASGSVLSPGTWKQGIEALRELTVRRG